MRIGSLFSGYGGLDLAVQSVLGGEVAWHVEYDKAPSRILDHHFPGVPNYGDVTKLDFTSIEPVDVLTGGYPCQPFSHAGLRKGTDDDRHLWPHVLRAIREMGPRLAVLENVRGHLSLGFDTVLADLASVGWSARWGVVRASDAGACHQRARLFILAYPERSGWEWGRSAEFAGAPADLAGDGQRTTDAQRQRHDRSRGPVSEGKPGSRWPDAAGLADAPADASGQRHGRGQDAGMVGRLGATPEGSGRQASPARSQSRDRGPADAADATIHGWDGCSCQPDAICQSHLRRFSGQDTATVGNGGGQSTADAHLASGKARGNPRHDSQRIRVEPMGLAASLADPNFTGLERSESSQQHELLASSGPIIWGDYGPAIARWERVIGRAAPRPTEPGRTGAPRLSPAFVEWMMGLPAGWVTDPAIGISRNEQLKALGNGVVPQQAALALDVLLQGATDDLRQRFATV